MTDLERADTLAIQGGDLLGPTVREILTHLCGGAGRGDACRSFGMVIEWCEGRGDCTFAVICPGCAIQFLVDEEELDELRRWTDAEGNALVCGVRWE